MSAADGKVASYSAVYGAHQSANYPRACKCTANDVQERTLCAMLIVTLRKGIAHRVRSYNFGYGNRYCMNQPWLTTID